MQYQSRPRTPPVEPPHRAWMSFLTVSAKEPAAQIRAYLCGKLFERTKCMSPAKRTVATSVQETIAEKIDALYQKATTMLTVDDDDPQS